MKNEIKITPADAGCWLDGHMGWQNHYRVVDRAVAYGFELDAGDQEVLDAYREDRNGIDDDLFGEVIGQGGLVDRATGYLETLAPVGYHFEWDMGELSLLPCSEIEGHGPACEVS